MNLEKLRKHKKRKRWLEGIFSRNPVFVGGLALPFAIMITTSLKNSVSVSILLACSLIPTVLLASLIGTRIPRWIGTMLYAMFSMVLVLSCVQLINPISRDVTNALGIYIPILAVNTIQSTLCQRYSRETRRPAMALVDAVTYSIGFALALCLIGAVREVLGAGTLWGISVGLPFKASGLLIGFAGFILVALFSGVYRFCARVVSCALYRRQNPGEI